MSFDALIAKVEQAERVLEARERLASAEFGRLKSRLARGVDAGTHPRRRRGREATSSAARGRCARSMAATPLQMLGALAGLFAGGNARAAAEEAADAAQHAEHAGDAGAD